MTTSAQSQAQDELFLVYDGECPFCSHYVKMVRLREAVGKVHLIDARSDHPKVQEVVDMGLDLNEGMVLFYNGEVFYGDDCIHRLAVLSTDSTAFNKLNAMIFRSKSASRVLYPVLKQGRKLALKLLGRQQITTVSQ